MNRLAPDLFDKRFQDLMQIGRALLPSLAPGWTDHNAHDPGITLMELLAWITEAQLYALGHMRRDERAAYAALLGITPGGTRAASGLIWPDRSDPSSPVKTYVVSMVLSKDKAITVMGSDSPTFRPSATLLWAPGSVTRLMTRDRDGHINDHTATNGRGVAFLPFGEHASRRDVLALTFACRDAKGLFGGDKEDRQKVRGAYWPIGVLAAPPIGGAVIDNPAKNSGTPLRATLITNTKRVRVRIASDTTRGLLTSGVILLDLDDVEEVLQEFTLELRASGGLARPPRLLRIEPNVIPIEQGTTISYEAHQSNGAPDMTVTLRVPGLRFGAGQNPIIVKTDEPSPAWFSLSSGSDVAHALNIGYVSHGLRKQFQSHGATLSSAAMAHIIQAGNQWTIEDTDQAYVIERDDQMLHVYKTWRRCNRLAACGPDEDVYEFDAGIGQITFGNGINGRIPPAGSEVLVTYAVSDGQYGNVARNRPWKVLGIEGVYGTNLDPITGGGAPAQPIEERRLARQRFREDHALVTVEDIEAAALALPLLEVARAWVAPQNDDAPHTGLLTLVALRSRQNGIEPEQIPETAQWLEAIRRSLASHMLLGTRLAVVAPRYVDFSIRVVLEAHPRLDPDKLKEQVHEMLGKRLTVDGSAEGTTPRLPGVPVTKRDLAVWLRTIPGIKRVVDSELFDANGSSIPTIEVPRNGLPRWNPGNSEIAVTRSGLGSIS